MCPSTHPSISILVFFHSAYPLYSQNISLSLSLFLVIPWREDPEASSLGTMPNKSSLVRPEFPPALPSLLSLTESSSPNIFHTAPSLHFLFRRQRGALAHWTTVCSSDKLETFSLATSRRWWLYSHGKGRVKRIDGMRKTLNAMRLENLSNTLINNLCYETLIVRAYR